MPISSRPNFLLFITDQHRADFFGCYGHPVLRTPHIDSIAARGTAFDRFYVASPVCQPNRASLMTARMPSVHDVRSNGIPLSMEAVTFVDLLRDAGYRTALVGKSHLQNFTAWRSHHQAPAAARRVSTSRRPASRQSLRDHLGRSEIRAGDAALLDQAGRAGAHAVLRLRSCDAGPRAWRRAGRRLRPLARCARSEGQGAARHRRTACRTTTRCRRPIAPRSPRSFTPPHSSATAPAPISTRPRATQPFFLMVSFPDPHHPFNPPRQILGHVQARAVSGAGGILAQRLDAAGAGAEHHQGARGRQGQSHRAWARSACRRARRRRRGRSPAA